MENKLMTRPFFFLGKQIGVIRPDRTFIARRRKEQIFRKFNGLGISYYVLMRLIGMNCKHIVLLLELDNTTLKFETTPKKFIELGQIYTDRINDNQRILSFDQLLQTNMNQYMEE